MRSHGWEPGRIEHLLVFGGKYPDAQLKNPIVALGSVGKVGGDLYVPYLYRCGSERNLCLGRFDGDWGAHYRFLAVRKKVLAK